MGYLEDQKRKEEIIKGFWKIKEEETRKTMPKDKPFGVITDTKILHLIKKLPESEDVLIERHWIDFMLGTIALSDNLFEWKGIRSCDHSELWYLGLLTIYNINPYE